MRKFCIRWQQAIKICTDRGTTITIIAMKPPWNENESRKGYFSELWFIFSNDAPGFKINVKTLFCKTNAINENSKYVFVSKISIGFHRNWRM